MREGKIRGNKARRSEGNEARAIREVWKGEIGEARTNEKRESR